MILLLLGARELSCALLTEVLGVGRAAGAVVHLRLAAPLLPDGLPLRQRHVGGPPGLLGLHNLVFESRSSPVFCHRLVNKTPCAR